MRAQQPNTKLYTHVSIDDLRQIYDLHLQAPDLQSLQWYSTLTISSELLSSAAQQTSACKQFIPAHEPYLHAQQLKVIFSKKVLSKTCNTYITILVTKTTIIKICQIRENSIFNTRFCKKKIILSFEKYWKLSFCTISCIFFFFFKNAIQNFEFQYT